MKRNAHIAILAAAALAATLAACKPPKKAGAQAPAADEAANVKTYTVARQ